MENRSGLAPLEDACTVVLLRDGAEGLETLMLERPSSSSSFGGVWVFPGGKVDPEDRTEKTGGQLDSLAAARAAGLRELAEETGQQLSPDELVWLAQWIPMQPIPRRFRTWFMLAAATSEQVVLNSAEHEKYAWLTPAEALARHAAGAMELVAPTWVTLHNLGTMGSAAQALERAREGSPFVYNSHLLMPNADAGPAGVVWAGDATYPGSQEPAGARHRLITTALPWIFEHTA
ncbi:NUDIX hydrolase [Arthrobacter sp. H35-D1]|uniref:NUDIX hydrolase n=1 Tax=Arthrobacter sp. H35-D1 TaxID=3046202 RepID=UPI0024BA9849|nr:NUDIX hydrolase [Arthrobacter sp. H35-D1]MDJ0314523.1 NUDIX hydrolase [Arthrobacter sp. H35-D1]